ncbi:prepilin-type N-terminal cleavage/methylation domain-containing protein [Parahaliea sp. F7430]|uniref:Prepilin-type N-terminal cleavage/methylation domain-containing protein n=1 Tax=Sediminihaliea albiluteola TaxID=2758564 RepID=A0A7W2TYH1_9GAMM|nr:prepilin-type N-terminal cleavage/methylation domain-containing protein [Sediminihaliea albiluteola]MBA6414267.1 prepilin-type N-terminal cleavage/methylation domain-containing protein [Sediminihaliea albiluteola]
MWVTGVSCSAKLRPAGQSRGFTLIELMAALAIAAIVLAVAVPATVRVYDSMRYRESVRDVLSFFTTARYQAVSTGRVQDVEVVPDKGLLRLGDKSAKVASNMNLTVHAARELNRSDTGVIRFYPDGGSSGGGVDIESNRGTGISIKVDWLMGRVSQESYAIE